MRTYYGMELEHNRPMFATVTGQMDDGTLVYTEIKMNDDGSMATENGDPVLLLDNQYVRRMRYGTQTFVRI